MERELEKTINDINVNIPKSDWEKLQQAAQHKNELEENILKLYQELERLEKIELD